MADARSPWYPYINVQQNYFDLRGAETIPRKICDYLIDAPSSGYTPADDNTFPRCRIWKYLYYDGAKPLENALPTIEQKMSVVFDPSIPEEPPTDKGYRLYPQIYIKQAQETAQTRIMVYMGRTVPSNDELFMELSVIFDVYTHYTQEANTRTDAYNRAFAIEQALIEAFHGVNMAGVGTFYFSKLKHADCGSNVVYDGTNNVGRRITMALEIPASKAQGQSAAETLAEFNPGTAGLYLW